MIIIEGPDNAGKSTLAHKLGLEYKHPGPAPINNFELNMCLHTQLQLMKLPIVHDRVTCISHQVYNEGWFNNHLLRQYLDQFIACKQVLFIYCRPSESHLMNFAHHKAKDYDTEDHIKRVINNQHQFIQLYDKIFESIPHIVYDFTDQDMFKYKFIDEIINFTHGKTNNLESILIGGKK